MSIVWLQRESDLESSEGLRRHMFGGWCCLSVQKTSGGLGQNTYSWPFHVAWVSSQCGGWVVREEEEKERRGREWVKKGFVERQRPDEPMSLLALIAFRSHMVLFPIHFVLWYKTLLSQSWKGYCLRNASGQLLEGHMDWKYCCGHLWKYQFAWLPIFSYPWPQTKWFFWVMYQYSIVYIEGRKQGYSLKCFPVINSQLLYSLFLVFFLGCCPCLSLGGRAEVAKCRILCYASFLKGAVMYCIGLTSVQVSVPLLTSLVTLGQLLSLSEFTPLQSQGDDNLPLRGGL